MPSFKPKPDKKLVKIKNNNKNLDTIHNELMINFDELNNNLPKLYKKKKKKKKI